MCTVRNNVTNKLYTFIRSFSEQRIYVDIIRMSLTVRPTIQILYLNIYFVKRVSFTEKVKRLIYL